MLRRPRHLGGDAAAAPVFSVVRHFEPAGAAAYTGLPFAVTRLDEMLPVDEELTQDDLPRVEQDDLPRVEQDDLPGVRQDDLRRLNKKKVAGAQRGVRFTEKVGDYIHLQQALVKLFLVIVFFKYVHNAIYIAHE